MSALEKIKRLEEYLAVANPAADTVLETAIDKLLAREVRRLADLKGRLREQISAFERTYAMNSSRFHGRFESGELGDAMDFMEWAATLEMLENTEKHLALLEENSSR